MNKFVISLGETQITASDANGPIIATINMIDYRAYNKLEDIRLEGGRTFLLSFGPMHYRYTLESITGSPLTFNAAESQFEGNTIVQVYTGQLNLIWMGRRILFMRPRRTSGSSIVNATVRFQYRIDNQNIELYCYDPDNPVDADALICVYMHGEMATPPQGMFSTIFSMAKSNMPFQGPQADPAQFDIRKPSLIGYLE